MAGRWERWKVFCSRVSLKAGRLWDAMWCLGFEYEVGDVGDF